MANFCPCCGYNIEADRPIDRDGWHIEPSGSVWFRGKFLRMRPAWATILHSIAKKADGCVSRIALLNRVTERENDNLLSAHVSHIKRFLAERGIALPIESVRGNGYRWCAAENLQEAA